MAFFNTEMEKQRIIQEFVPGKQITLAHIIAHPEPELYKKMGAVGSHQEALGILTITPSEAAIIGADLAMKAATVEVVFVDRFSGSLLMSGEVASVEESMNNLLRVFENVLHFSSITITYS